MAAVSLRGLVTLQGLLDRSQAGASQALQLNSHLVQLEDAGQTMERAARQYLVLGDRALRQAFERAAGEARIQVRALATAQVQAARSGAYERWLEEASELLRSVDAPAPWRDAELAQIFAELARQTRRMAEQLRQLTEERNAALQAQLDSGRAAWAREVAAAIALALGLALLLALGLARPLRRVELAIAHLGENRLDERIDIRGPADVRQLGRRLDALRQRLHEADADKARFLRHVSHELKTPLAALREGVALLDEGVAGPLSPQQQEVAKILADNAATLQRRIEDLLRFNAAAFAAQRPVRQRTDMGALLRSLIDEQQLQWRARGLQVQLSQQPEGRALHAEVDPALLGTAVANLLSNAIRYSPDGGRIELRLLRQGEALAIEVADQGPGVPEAERGRIFEPFFRGQHQPAHDGAQGLPGTGIGLSIVAETVAAHGGRITYLAHHPRLDLAATSAAASTGLARAAGPEGAGDASVAAGLPGLAGMSGACFRIELPHAFVT